MPVPSPFQIVDTPLYDTLSIPLGFTERRYFSAPLWKVADPAVLFAVGANGLIPFNADERLAIVSSLRHCFDQGDPPLIQSYAPFRVDLKVDPRFEWDKLSSPGSLVVVLEGLLRRPVM